MAGEIVANSFGSGDSKRQHINETAYEYGTFIVLTSNIYILQQRRKVLTQGFIAYTKTQEYPANIGQVKTYDYTDVGSGLTDKSLLYIQRSTPMNNEWYKYEEIWKTYGDWEVTPGQVTT